jgi:hypothetical protein
MKPLLTRDDFRNAVFKRDNYKCVICQEPAVDAHHIIERRLFEDGGYYSDNGASVCSKHHILAEQTVLSCEEIRSAAKITIIILPKHLYEEFQYDKWGNIILPSGQRLKGDLFFDESVQKILKEGNVLNEFSKYIKHPRTFHVHWSETISDDDKRLLNNENFEGKHVVITVKLDGEQTTWYNDYMHARSLEYSTHPSRKFVKGMWSQVAYLIPEGWRVCGENVYAKHAIEYHNLESYFYVHSIWNEKNICLSWEETKEYATLLGLQTVPELYCGVFNEKIIRSLYSPEINGDRCEGYVIRNIEEFRYSEYKRNVAKFVSGDFKVSHGHWIKNVVVPNKLKSLSK